MKHWCRNFLIFLSCSSAVYAQPSFDYQASYGYRKAPGAVLLPASQNPSPLDKSNPDSAEAADAQIKSVIDRIMGAERTRILMVSVDRKVVLERYAQGWMRDATPLGYSMSKSLVALTVGHAACDGKLNLNQKGEDVAPKLAGTSWGNATIKQILNMRSGSAILDPAKAGWKTDALGLQHQQIYKGNLTIDYYDMLRKEDEQKFPPGESFQYNNLDTFALVLIVQAAVNRSFSEYFQEKIWQPVQSANAGAWLQNTHGQTAGATGFSAAPEDWIRLGHYVLDQHAKSDTCFGKFLHEATEPISRSYIPSRCYGYQMWNWCDKSSFMFFGYAGQYLIMNPANKVVLYAHQGSHVADAAVVEVYRRLLASASQQRNKAE
jgi:CubicO group peptidase (beta-lactamase class C family)